jgi:hypothetical protein
MASQGAAELDKLIPNTMDPRIRKIAVNLFGTDANIFEARSKFGYAFGLHT